MACAGGRRPDADRARRDDDDEEEEHAGMQDGVTRDTPGPIATGVRGLDSILGGGLPGPRLYLLQGAPGTGKTTLALQFLLAGARLGEPVVYVTLSQTRAELEQIAASHGWPLDGVRIEELSTAETIEDATDQTIFQTADIQLDRTRRAVEDAIRIHRPRRAVYDSLLEIRHLSGDGLRFRREVLGFKAFLATHRIATLLIDTEAPYGGDLELEGVAHGIVRLDKALPEYGNARRRVEVKKMRGVAYSDGYHDMSIRRGVGVEIYPREVPNLGPEAARTQLIKSNVRPLDDMLGGGLEAGTTTLIVGQAGTGKSTLASLYATAALERGEGVAMFLFEERLETFFRRSEGLGMNLRPHRESGLLQIRDFDPVEVSPGEFAQIARRAVEEHAIRVVLIDSFTGYLSSLPRGEEAVMQMQALLKYLTRRGALVMLVVAQHGLLGQEAATDVDVSFLGDAVLLLRMYEWPGVVRRTITVVKKRHGPHDLAVHELTIRPEGVSVLPFNPPPPGPAGPVAAG
jgi:circadian clock protein KaiC